MKFPYPKLHFLIRFMALTAILAAAIYLLQIPEVTDTLSMRIIGAMLIAFLAVIILTITPLFTAHEMNEVGMHLRNGLVFNISIRFDEIASVEAVGTRPWAFGLLPTMAMGKVTLANGNRNLVSIKLKSRKRFRSLLARSFDEIIIDLVSPDEFVKMANLYLKR